LIPVKRSSNRKKRKTQRRNMNSKNGSFTACSIRPPSVGELTVSLLERDPRRYYGILQELSRRDDPSLKQALKEKLNETPYESFHSNHVLSLSRLVGRLNQRAIDEFGVGGAFYGSNNIGGIDGELANNLLKVMLNCGGDIAATDYYGDNIIDLLTAGENDSIFYRIGAEEYLRTVEIIHSASAGISEGIPP
jgi:hypothetical protein